MLPNSLNNKEENTALTLSKLTTLIRQTLNAGFPDQFWVIAEISEFHLNSSGHAYLELVEKSQDSQKTLARMRATIWSYSFRMLRPYFEGTTGYQFSAGIKVMVKVSLEFHAQYSISLNIKDIDPSYTLGDLARRKAEIIDRLTREGVINMNKQLEFPLVPQRIAVISSSTAAGFEDFLKTLSANSYNFHFEVSLFQAIMQGENAEQSIIHALEKIYESENAFDLIVLIRGGGATIELDCFNNYDLAFHISQFPLPVITGIGHERDETVADIVAHKKLKTPTAVAEMLIDRMADFLTSLEQTEEYLRDFVQQKVHSEKEKISFLIQNLLLNTKQNIHTADKDLNNKVHKLKSVLQGTIFNSVSFLNEKKNQLHYHLSNLFSKEREKIKNLTEKTERVSFMRLKEEKTKLSSLEHTKNLSNPDYILSKGYSITTFQGQVMKNANKLKKDDEIITILHKGKLTSKVK
ncbi:MAG: exodeoxyribonuclease VII large subunit [Bacteroidota bacterium]